MSQLQTVIDTLDHAADAFDGIANAEQKKIYDEVITLAKDLDTDPQGKVKQSVANLKRLTQIKAKLAALSKDKEWVAGITQFAQYFGTLQQQQNAYYTAHFPSLTLSAAAKQKHQLMKQLAVQNTMDALMGSGLQANVTDKLNDILLRAVTTGAKFADLQEELRTHLLGKDGGQGAFARYATTYATTALSQFTGQNNKLLTDDLGCDWFMYVGSNKETTREFCSHLTAKKFVHRSEIPDLLKGKIDDYQCAIYPKTNLPYGMIDGTTPDNFQCNCGGWNCRHQLIPVADAVVPANLRAKFAKQQPLAATNQTTETQKPIDLTPYQKDIDFVKKYVADHSEDALAKWYLDGINKGEKGTISEVILQSVLKHAIKHIQKKGKKNQPIKTKKQQSTVINNSNNNSVIDSVVNYNPQSTNNTPQYQHEQEEVTISKTIDKVKRLTQTDIQTAVRLFESVKSFTYQWDYDIRQMECGNDVASIHNHSKADIAKKANELEDFIARSPQWAGVETYRGISLSKRETDELRKELKNGTANMRGTASWTTDRQIAEDFALSKGTTDNYGNARNQQVILIAKSHSKATSVMYLSDFPDEQEVIASKNCRYKLIRERQQNGYIIFEVEPSTPAK